MKVNPATRADKRGHARRQAILGVLLMVGVGVVLGATVFGTDIAQATGLDKSGVTVKNTALRPAAFSAFAALAQLESGGKVKVVIAGTNDKSDVTNGSLAGTGTFNASGAITDKGIALGYRTVKGNPSSAAGALITLRFVTKGKKGTITYVVKIDTKAATSRWTIASGTRAYKGLRGRGTESENASFTVSTLRGTVSR